MTPPAAAAAAPAVQPRRAPAPARRRTAPSRPRRVSGPARGRPGARAAVKPARRDGGLPLGVLALIDRVSSHRFLDRLVRGRASIALVAFALIGIVTLQLGLLKLNSSIGRTLERESVLQRENAALSVQNSDLAAGERIQARATQLGMALVPVSAFRFLTAPAGGDASRAAAALRTPVRGSESSEAGTPSGASTAASGEASSASGEQSSATASEPSSSEPSSAASSQARTPAGQPTSAPEGTGTQSSSAPSSASGAGEASAGGGEATPAGGTQAAPTG